MLPRASVWNNTVLVTTPSQTYTANDYEALFSDAEVPQGFSQFSVAQNINIDFQAPNVSTYCFYGVGIQTPMSFIFDNGLDGSPTTIWGKVMEL